jgi:hypothetical protein
VVNRLASRRLVFAVFVLVALGAIYAAAGLRHPAAAAGQTASHPTQAPVVSALRACAAPGEAGPDAGSLALASLPGPAAPAGRATVTRLVAGGSGNHGPLVTSVTQPGALALTAVKAAAPLPKSLLAGQPGSSPQVTTTAGRGGVVISATGAMAQGLAVEQTGPAGLVTAQCGSPGTNFWFVGPGQGQAADIELYLMNTDSQAADAEVTAITDVTKNDQVGQSADNSITVPPHSMVTQSLGTMLQSSRVMALNITASVGRLVAAVRESKSGSADGGWLPATEAPAKSLYIPGIPATAGARDLYIAVPGSATAQVKVTVVTAKGSYQPTGGTNIPLLENSGTIVPLPSLGFVAGTVKITSTVPVVAAMLIGGGPSGAAGAVAASAGPVEEQGVLADSPVGGTGSIGARHRRRCGLARERPERDGCHHRCSHVRRRPGQGSRRAPGWCGHDRGHATGRLGTGLCRARGQLSRRSPVDSAGAELADMGWHARSARIAGGSRALVVAWVAGIDGLRIHPEPAGELLHDDIQDQFGQFLLAVGSRHERTAVQHDPGRALAIQAVQRAWLEAGQRDRVGVVGIGLGRWYLLDRELNPGKLSLPARLELGDRQQHQVVEPLGSRSVQRNLRRRERAAQSAAMPVPAMQRWDSRAAATGSVLHGNRAYPIRARWPAQRSGSRRHDRAVCPRWWRYRPPLATVSRCE